MTIEALRTPDVCFADIPDVDFPVGYVDDLTGYEGLRIAYVDAGPNTPYALSSVCTASQAGRFSTAG